MALGRKKKKGAETEAAKQSKDEVEAEAAEAVASSSPPEPEPAEPVEKAYPDEMPVYRVLKTKIVSIRGAVTTLAEGKVLDPRYYGGPRGIEQLLESGVELEVIS